MAYGPIYTGTIYDSDDEAHTVSELQSVYGVIARANNTTSDNVAAYDTSSSLSVEYLYLEDEDNLVLQAWDTLTTPYVISSYSSNSTGGYDVVTDQGTFEFVTPENYKLREKGNVKGWGAVGDYDLTTNTVTTDDTDAFLAAVDYAMAKNGSVFVPGTGNAYVAYYVADTLELCDGGWSGVLLVGENVRFSNIAFNIASGVAGISISGTSGYMSGCGVRNISIFSHTASQGIGLLEQGPCVTEVYNFGAYEFEAGIKLYNQGGSGIFTEFGTHKRFWLKDNDINIWFAVGTGDASFHGASFENGILNNTTDQTAIQIDSGCNVYNSSWHMNIFGDDTVTFILNNGTRNGDDRIYFEGSGAVENNGSWQTVGRWRMQSSSGDLTDNSTIPFVVGDSYITPVTPTDDGLTDMGITSITNKRDVVDENLGANLVRLSGSNIESLGVIGYDAGTFEDQGLAILSASYEDSLTDVTLRAFFHLNGIRSYRTNYVIGYTDDTTDQLSINSSGRHSGVMGRNTTGTITGDSDSQTVTTSSFYTKTTGENSLMTLRLYSGTDHQTTYLYAIATHPYSSATTATLLATTIDDPYTGFVAPSDVGVNSSGNITFALTSTIDLTYDITLVGIGSY